MHFSAFIIVSVLFKDLMTALPTPCLAHAVFRLPVCVYVVKLHCISGLYRAFMFLVPDTFPA